MSKKDNTAQALELFKRYGRVRYDTLRKRAKNVPDLVMRLRRKGYGIESEWTVSRNGVKHVCAYRYHSKAA